MGTWALLATAVALAMDAFTVAVAAGINLKRVSFRQTVRLALHFGVFQALMPMAGWGLGTSVHSLIRNIDHWAATALLVFVGGKMVFEALGHHDRAAGRQDPTKGASLIMLSIATSLDALAVGFSLSMLRISIWWPALVIGVTAALFTAAGMHAGRFVGSKSRLDRYAEVLGGLILVGIGFAILREHGVFQ
jgi:putative Mn2+ efflux pump MntP